MEKVSKKRGKIITDREELLVCQQYKDGWTLRKIATYANISQTTVMAILRRRRSLSGTGNRSPKSRKNR